MKRRTFLAASLGAATAACSPGTTVDPAPTPTATNPVASTIAELGPVTLTVWDQEVLPGQHTQIETLNAQFQAEFTNVTVRRLSQSFDDLRKQAARVLHTDTVPDVVQVSTTRADMGAFVGEGLLLSLAAFAERYGWTTRFSAGVLRAMRYSDDGLGLGDGELYAIPQTGSMVGFYYRQRSLDELGGQRPGHWEDMFALLDGARAAGAQPMVLGNLEKWPALHMLGPLQAAFLPADEVVALALGVRGGNWLSDGSVQALARLAAWSADGYLGDSPNSVSYEGAARSFVEGKAAFLFAGSWLAAGLELDTGEELRFMAPPPGLDGTPVSAGGTGVPWAIPAKAAHPEVAAAYLDFITSPAAMGTIAASGAVPVLRTAELAPEAGVNRDIFDAFAAVSQRGVLAPFLGNATPTFGQSAGVALQELIGGQKAPETVARQLQADYAGFVS